MSESVPESVEAARELLTFVHMGGREWEDIAEFERRVRAEGRNRLLNPSDELVEAVRAELMKPDRAMDWERLARAALQAAGSALDSGSAG